LQKLLAAAGVASRRRAETWLRAGRVSVDGVVARLGDSADPDVERIDLDGRPLALEPLAYWILHKPRGVVTTSRDPQGRQTVLDLLPRSAHGRLFPVGRLDRDTEGLLLLTNDGAVAQALLHPALGSEREYRVTARGAIPSGRLARLARGVDLPDGRTAPARVGAARFDPRSEATTFALTLREGRKRQIRLALQALGHPVVRLVRVRMGPITLGRLAPGAARPLRPDEVGRLRRHAQRCAARRPNA
jgi:23S rRNA pseudouridine2605 synthase